MAEIIVVHGYPGSGKSTHSQHLVETSLQGRPVIHASAGNRLRDIRTLRADSQFQDIIRDPSIPLPLDNHIVNGALFELIPPDEASAVVLIDGYPRHPGGVDTFLHMAARERHRLLGCLSLEISPETSLARLQGRGVRQGEKLDPQDDEAHARRRYNDHDVVTIPAIETLSEHMPLIRIDANGDLETVREEFTAAIAKLACPPPPPV